MGAAKHQGTLNKFSESFFLKMTTTLLLSVSVVSIIVSCPSLVPFLLHNFKFSFSAYKMQQQFFGFNIDKNYMFLLCNGILVFIVKNSGLISKSPKDTDLSSKKVNKTEDKRRKVVKFSEMKASIVEKKVFMGVEAAQETEKLSLVAEDAENGSSVAQYKEEEEKEENQFLINDEDEEGIGSLSREELNKKCDDFIRKMKEVIKFEAQQLIVV